MKPSLRLYDPMGLWTEEDLERVLMYTGLAATGAGLGLATVASAPVLVPIITVGLVADIGLFTINSKQCFLHLRDPCSQQYDGYDCLEAALSATGAAAAGTALRGLARDVRLAGGAPEVTGGLPGNYRPDRALPRDPVHNVPVPHSQLGTAKGRKVGNYTQAREWGYDSSGNLVPKRTIDFTDHGRPAVHTNPHQHDHLPNSTGGTRTHESARPMEWP